MIHRNFEEHKSIVEQLLGRFGVHEAVDGVLREAEKIKAVDPTTYAVIVRNCQEFVSDIDRKPQSVDSQRNTSK